SSSSRSEGILSLIVVGRLSFVNSWSTQVNGLDNCGIMRFRSRN
ncbi:8872_t:CDS:1, partial [Ambispora leptoticha]